MNRGQTASLTVAGGYLREERDASAFRNAVERVAIAVRRYASAAGKHPGADCYFHAALGQALLKDLSFEADLVAGNAAWRLGPGRGDVLAHLADKESQLTDDMTGFPYHTWLEREGIIIDVTTYQLRLKAQQLDALDGGRTSVTWCPPYLLLPREQVMSFPAVRDGYIAGTSHYEERPQLAERLKAGFNLHPRDLLRGRMILANPAINIKTHESG